jgi:RNA polymerase sigma-70 factor (ECF subfamily)
MRRVTDSRTATVPAELERSFEELRPELTGYAYRMLGSPFEAEDAVQETFIRAWRAYEGFEGRSSLRSWLYRIATNVSLDMLNGRERRARPMDLGPALEPIEANLNTMPEATWIQPVPDPAVLTENRETTRLAIIAALQHLPPRQRAVLILCEVLRWRASEVAELLETSVASVNSALQRARATLEERDVTTDDPANAMDDEHQDLLQRYMDAFERYDMEALTALLHEDATMSMPPYALWLTGHEDIVSWMMGPGHACDGSRLVPVAANGSIAFGQYRASGPNGEHEPWGLVVIETKDGQVSGINTFLDTASLFPLFGLPPSLGA